MQAVFEVGLAAEQDPLVHKNSLVREFEESLQWWLHTRPEVACNCYPSPHPLASLQLGCSIFSGHSLLHLYSASLPRAA